MLKELLLIPLAIAACLFVFLATERAFSPSFQACINQNPHNDRPQTAEEHNSGINVAIISAYALCTGKFVTDEHDGIIALGTLLIAAFTAVLWIATSRQARLTKEAFISEKR